MKTKNPSIKADNKTVGQTTLDPNDYVFITEDFAPFNFKPDGKKLEGISTNILLEVFKKIKLKITHKDINIFPWARAYKMFVKGKTDLISTNIISAK